MTIPAIPTPRHGGDALNGHIMTEAEKRQQDYHAHWVWRFGATTRAVSLADQMIADAEPVIPAAHIIATQASANAMRGL